MSDYSFETLSAPIEGIILKEKGSKFLGFAFPVKAEAEIKERLEGVRNLHPKATHHCYAYRLGVKGERYRANDDGEPGGSAGLPIYNQLLSQNISNVLLIVVRYYGGTKLGVGGLVKAYRATAKETLDAAEIVVKELTDVLEIQFPFELQNQIFTLLHRVSGKVLDFSSGTSCTVLTEIAARDSAALQGQLEDLPYIKWQKKST